MNTKTIKLRPPSFRQLAEIGIALVEKGTPEGRDDGRAMLRELGSALDALAAGHTFNGKYLNAKEVT